MEKKHPSTIKRSIANFLAFASIASLFIVSSGLLVHIDTLNRRVASLETNKVELEEKVAARDLVRCERDAVITQANTTTRYSVESAGYARTYQVHTPITYDASLRQPIILSFDGIEGSGARMESYSNLDALPALIVYADALPGKRGFTAWQGAPYSADGSRDLQFVRDILENLPKQYCTDSTRIFAVGMSNGGSFASLTGCELGDQIRAVASVSGANYTTCNQEQRTPSLLILHSTSDQQVPFAGSIERRLPEMSRWAEEQADERRCSTRVSPKTESAATTDTWLDCIDNAMVRFVTVGDQPHGWLQVPAHSDEVRNTAEYIWEFFEDTVYYNQ